MTLTKKLMVLAISLFLTAAALPAAAEDHAAPAEGAAVEAPAK